MSDHYILVTISGCEGSSSHQQATRHIHWLAGRPRYQPVRKVPWRETSGISNTLIGWRWWSVKRQWLPPFPVPITLPSGQPLLTRSDVNPRICFTERTGEHGAGAGARDSCSTMSLFSSYCLVGLSTLRFENCAKSSKLPCLRERYRSPLQERENYPKVPKYEKRIVDPAALQFDPSQASARLPRLALPSLVPVDLEPRLCLVNLTNQ